MKKTPRERRKQKNKDTILDSAAQLIHADGFENVSLRDIARKSDYSPAALYKYFESKEAIIQAVMVRENQKFIEQLGKVDHEMPPKQRLVELCLMYTQYALKNPVYLILINNMKSDRKTRQQPAPQTSPYIIFLEAVQAWANAEKVQLSDAYGAEEITYALWSLIHGMATLRLSQLSDFEADFDSANRRTLEIFLSGLKS